jgi:hypothetical protein
MERTAAAGAGWRWAREPVLAELDLARVSTAQGKRAMAVLRQVVAAARDENRGGPLLSARQAAAGSEDQLPGA